jgi:hypothetical protein
MVYNAKNHAENVRKALENGFLDSIGEDNITQTLDGEIEEIIVSYGNFLVENARAVLEEKDLVASSETKNSASFDSEIKGKNIKAIRFFLAEHWVNLHYGAKRSKLSGAKPPPVEELMKWITSKGIRVRQSNGQSTKSVLEQRKSMAFAIRQSIWKRNHSVKRFGRQGSRFMDEVLNQDSIETLAELLAEVSAVVVSYDLLSNFAGKIE